jgi:thiol-disulfide isomerase/thioredoxin
MPSTFAPDRRHALAWLAGAALPLASRASHELRPWPPGRRAPEVVLTDLDGKTWSLAGLNGRALLLNFWATWCEPCRAEMPSLELLAQRHEREGLAVLGVNFKETKSAVGRFLRATPLGLPIALDPDGAAANAWGVYVLPSTVLIDRGARPRGVVLGELDWAGPAARSLVEPLFAAPRAS